MVTYLNNYPLEECNDRCYKYMCGIDWVKVHAQIKENTVAVFDVSDIIELFPHLELDDRYSLLCYSAEEYHGLFGNIAAVKKGECNAPIIIKKKWVTGPLFELPENAAPPMEAIYNDGSPEGYFEAVLISKLLNAAPYFGYLYEHWDNYIVKMPDGYNDEWESYIDIRDCRPRINGNKSVYACMRKFENGAGSSDGIDRIYLCQHNFCVEPKALGIFNNKKSKYKAHLYDEMEYSKKRCSCVFSENRVLIAKQLKY